MQRDIRVVPVLVDGGQLPGADDLPAELQPLLLRQSFEISNKRWDYDTEQLINMLIKFGVMPKPSPMPIANGGNKTWWKKNSWWVYMLIGMIITISVLVNIADEKNQPGPVPNNNGNTNSTHDGDEPLQKDLPQNQRVDPPPVNNRQTNIDGNWALNYNGIIYTYDIIQNGNQLSMQVYNSGQNFGSGNGYNNNGYIDLNLNLGGVYSIAKGTLSADGNMIVFNYTIQATGQIGQFSLVRQNEEP